MKYPRHVGDQLQQFHGGGPATSGRRPATGRDPFDRFSAPASGDGTTGADRRHVDEAVIGQVAAAGASDTGQSRVLVRNPSPRVRLKLVFAFFQNVPTSMWASDAVPSITNSKLTIVPWEADVNGNEAAVDAVVSLESLPYAYEAETAAENLRCYIDMVKQTSALGFFKAIATWSPEEEMSDERWQAIRSRCGVNRTGPIIRLNAGTSL